MTTVIQTRGLVKQFRRVTARRRALIAEVLARLPPDTQRAAAEAFPMFAQAAREPSGNPRGLPYHHPPRMTQRSRHRTDQFPTDAAGKFRPGPRGTAPAGQRTPAPGRTMRAITCAGQAPGLTRGPASPRLRPAGQRGHPGRSTARGK